MANNETEIFGEILASDKLTAYNGFSRGIYNTLGTDDPSIVWEQLKYNPWFAMAIYDEIEEKDSTIYSCLNARKTAVLSYDRNVLPASDSAQDKKIAEFVEETLRDYFGSSENLDTADEGQFDSFLYESLDAIGRGMSIGEIIYAEASDRIYVKEVKFKPQHLFAFGDTNLAAYSTASMMYPQTGRLCLRQGVLATALPLGTELPEQKFFVFSYHPRYGNRWGSPVLRKVYWQSWIKRNSIKQWLRYQEKGSGVVVARYNDGAAADEMQKANDAATAVQEESAVAIPKKFILEVHEMVRNIGSSHKELVDDFCNSEITKAIPSGTLTGTATARRIAAGHTLLSPNVLTKMIDSIAFVDAVTNVPAIDSGTELESLESTLQRVKRYQRRGERIVSAKDLEDAILNDALNGNGVVRVFPFVVNGQFGGSVNDPNDPAESEFVFKPGHTTVIVMTKNGETIDEIASAKIAALLEQAVGNQFIYVVNPLFVNFDIEVDVRLNTGSPSGAIVAAVERNLRNFYSPSREQFGRAIYRSEIIAVIEGTNGVDRIEASSSQILISPLTDTKTREFELPRLVGVQINVV